MVNQLVAFGLAILMVVLAMASVLLSNLAAATSRLRLLPPTDNRIFEAISYLWLTAATGFASIVFFFSIYWLLPNRRILRGR